MSSSSWFTTDYDYSGYAEAVFEEPQVRLYGPATVTPDERGRPIVEITVERSEPLIETDIDIMRTRYGSRPTTSGGEVISFGEKLNRVSATVRGAGGVFQCGPDWNCDLSMLPGKPLMLRIIPIKSEFGAATTEIESFVVLPLTGFVSELPKTASTIRDHPLRMDSGPDADLGTFVSFELDGKAAFIQQFPGNANVSEGKYSTAVAVLPFTDPKMVDPWDWFLTTFLRLLELATGSEVGVPWIETRNGDGTLIRRLHFAIGNSKEMSDGYGALKKPFHWRNGEYLTAALSSPLSREPFFSIALRHCVRAGLPGLTLDDQLDHLVRALECLCLRYGLSRQDLMKGLAPTVKQQIGTVLRNAGTEVRNLASALTESVQQAQVLRISERAHSADQKDQSFGLAVGALVCHFGLGDFEVLDPYYQRHPRLDGRGWLGALSFYRGAVFHEGFVDIDAPGTDIGEVYGFILHLHDLVVRILLKIIGYSGTYQPRLIRFTADETADWFKPGVNIDNLLKVPTLGIK